MNDGIIRAARSSLAARAFLIGALLGLSGTAMAGLADQSGQKAPDGVGRYGIGHTTLVVTDTSRNLDGSTPATGSGRPLYVHIWYPTNVRTSQHVLYSWNN